MVEVVVAGQLFADTLASVDQRYEFEWDGTDAYGRPARGKQYASVRIGFEYHVLYRVSVWRADPPRYVWVTRQRPTMFWSDPTTLLMGQAAAVTTEQGSPQLGGWTLDAHHTYDPTAGVLYLGNGQLYSHADQGRLIDRYAGNGEHDMTGTGGTGLHRLDAPLEQIGSMITGSDGSLYLASFTGRIHRIDAETGVMSLFAGGGTLSEDGVLATEALLYSASGMAWGPDGSLYMVSAINSRVRRIAPDGRVYTVAGPSIDLGPSRGYRGDGGPAVAGVHPFDPAVVLFDRAQGIAVAPDGTVYIADASNEAIRRVSTDGIITTLKRTGGVLGRLRDLAVTRTGDVLFLHDNLLSRLSPDGTSEIIAGEGLVQIDGLPADEQSLDLPFEIAIGPGEEIYVSQGLAGNNTIKVIHPNGIMTTIAGAGPRGDLLGEEGNGGAALKAEFWGGRSIAPAPDGQLYINVGGTFYVRVVLLRSERFGGDDLTVPSPDGSLLYRFDPFGRHLETYEAATGVRVYAFEYDGSGLLTGVVDRDGLRTTIARDGAGTITVTGPYGHTTTLSENAAGYLERFAGPEGQIHEFTYNAGGSLTSQLDPRGNTSTYAYDEDGRVVSTTDQATAERTWSRISTDSSFTVTSRTALGRETVQQVMRTSDAVKTSSFTDPAGLTDVTTRRQDGTLVAELADGTVVTSSDVTDIPLTVPVTRVDTTEVTLPSGLTSTVISTTEREVGDPGDALSVTGTTASIQQVGSAGSWEVTHDVAAATVEVRSAEGRESKTQLDAKGRAVLIQSGTDTPVTITRDTQGRPAAVQQGARSASFTYGTNGLTSSATDPLSRTTQFFYDDADRLTRSVLADGREIAIGYDARDNPTTITPPGRTAHSFEYNPVNLVTGYRPPAVDASDPATYFSYDSDRALTGLTRPDGLRVNMTYDAAGRIDDISFPGGLVQFGYDGVSGNLIGVNGPYGGALSMSYDGALPVQVQLTGQVDGSVEMSYDGALRLAELRVNGSEPIGYTYDEDGLLLSAGGLTATRDAVNGRLLGTTLAGVSTTQSYSGLSELSSLDARFGGASLLGSTYTRDALGRIAGKAETRGGVTTNYAYTYDAIGRLTQVTEDGVPAESYTYDSNGNRTSFTGPGGVVTATYDAQDRMLTYGSNSYTYTPAGELTSKTQGASTTTYDYDLLGNLLGVTLPSGDQIGYVVDGAGRRVGRRVNGVLERGWLYQDALNPIAELDGAGTVRTRFVYGMRSYVPDFMERGGATYRIVSDERGSVRLVVDVATGAVVQELAYDAYGRVLVDTNPGFQPFGYAGGLYDPETGLVRFGARDYDAEVGRWTTKDPLGLWGGMNLYAYVGGDPVNLVDPWGLCPKPSRLERLKDWWDDYKRRSDEAGERFSECLENNSPADCGVLGGPGALVEWFSPGGGVLRAGRLPLLMIRSRKGLPLLRNRPLGIEAAQRFTRAASQGAGEFITGLSYGFGSTAPGATDISITFGTTGPMRVGTVVGKGVGWIIRIGANSPIW